MRRRLDFSILDIFAQGGALAFVELAVLVQVIFIKDLLGRRAVRAGPSETAGTTGTRADEFVRSQFPITILIQFSQSRRGVGDFVGIYHAVTVGVERSDDEWWRWPLAIAAWAALMPGRTLTICGRAARVLRHGCPGGHAECH